MGNQYPAVGAGEEQALHVHMSMSSAARDYASLQAAEYKTYCHEKSCTISVKQLARAVDTQ
jgi:hypothetical protein